MGRAITKCPQCGANVSPFAAGCAICGADLERARARHAARRRLSVPSVGARVPSGIRAARPDIDWLHIAVAYVIAVFVPIVGVFLALYWANQRHRMGQTVMVLAMLGAAALSVIALLAPVWFWSHLLHL
jgi:hypothetical protein